MELTTEQIRLKKNRYLIMLYRRLEIGCLVVGVILFVITFGMMVNYVTDGFILFLPPIACGFMLVARLLKGFIDDLKWRVSRMTKTHTPEIEEQFAVYRNMQDIFQFLGVFFLTIAMLRATWGCATVLIPPDATVFLILGIIVMFPSVPFSGRVENLLKKYYVDVEKENEGGCKIA